MTNDATPSLRAFGDADGDLAQLAGRRCAFIGYGNQGRAQALNLRDCLSAARVDCALLIATLRDRTWEQAEQDGFAPRSVEDAVAAADILFLLTPDEELPDVFRREIAPHVKANDTLVFASGYNLTYKEIALPPDVDVVLLAPRMIGQQCRQHFERGDGFYSYVSVEQDASGRAWPTVLALAKGIGSLTAPNGGALEVSANDETIIDLLMEQGFGALLGITMFRTLEVGMQAGLSPEALVLELYLSGEMAGTFEAMAELGLAEQSKLHSRTSQYGGMTRSMSLDSEPIRQHLEKVIGELQDGTFAREWAAERAGGGKHFEQLRSLRGAANPFTAIERRLRETVKQAQARRAPG